MEALGRGLASVMLQAGQKEPKEKRPRVIKTAELDDAVKRYFDPLVGEAPAPTAEQLDIFARDMEDAEPDEIAELTLRKVHEARARAEAQAQEEENPTRPATYDPNLPNPSPWTAP
jgi:hypothetical protein